MAKANISLPISDACCLDTLSTLDDCWAVSETSWNSSIAWASASDSDIPSLINWLYLLRYQVAPPNAIALLSPHCVGLNPNSRTFLFNLKNRLPGLESAISAKLTSIAIPPLLSFKKSEFIILI